MTLVLYEWRKLLRLPALWAFLALCLGLNGLLLWENSSIRPFFNESSEIAADLGGEILTLGSDAHEPAYLADHILEVRGILREMGFRRFCTFEGMRPMFHEL